MTDLELASFEIPIGLDSLKLSASGQLIGPIHVSINGSAFPEEPWTDFPGVILTWWSDALIPLLKQEAHEAEWLFMEGPYCVRLSTATHDSLRIETSRIERDGASVLAGSLVSTEVVVRALRRAVNGVLRRASEVGHAEIERDLSAALGILSIGRK